MTKTIDVAGLDLSSPFGAERAYRRILAAAKDICWSTASAYKGVARARLQLEHAQRCFDEAVDGALAQVTAKTGVDLERVAGSDRIERAALVAWR